MDLGLKGKNAAITGSSQGIGYAIATALAKEGCNVALSARGQERLDFTPQLGIRRRRLVDERLPIGAAFERGVEEGGDLFPPLGSHAGGACASSRASQARAIVQ